jgi:hypothetical protein
MSQITKQSSKQNGASTGGLTLLPRDVFTVQTTLASTKLTQNEGERKYLEGGLTES